MFWRLTLREIDAILEGVMARKVEAQNDLLFHAWHVEGFARQKRLPRLKDVLHQGPKRKQAAAEIEAITRSWLGSKTRKR